MQFINPLWSSLQASINIEQTADQDSIMRITRCIDIVQNALGTLKQQILDWTFKDTLEEIAFFKNQLPKFYSLFLYYTRILQIETRMPPGQNNQLKFLEREIKRLAIYFEQNTDWVLYYRSGATYMDKVYFMRTHNQHNVTTDCAIIFDERFSTPGTYPLSKIKALELLQTYLDNRITLVKNTNLPVADMAKQKFSLRWTASKSDLIELLYALHSSNLFNNNEYLDVRQIANWLESTLHIDLGNYYRVFQGIRIRKKNRTQFLDDLRENLIKRMDATDENPRY